MRGLVLLALLSATAWQAVAQTADPLHCPKHNRLVSLIRTARGVEAQPDFSYGQLTEAGRAWFQQNWEPNIRCLTDARLGIHGDGGKWVCDPACELKRDECVIFSVGSNNDFSFEEAMKPFGCKIHTFDHTVANPTAPEGLTTFHRLGLSDSDSGQLKTLQGMAEAAGVDHVDVLKIDCEGCELSVFAHAPTLAWLGANVRQMQLEVHFKTAPPVKTVAEGLFKAGFRTFSKARLRRGCGAAELRLTPTLRPRAQEANIQWSDGNCIEFSMLNLNYHHPTHPYMNTTSRLRALSERTA